MDDDEDLGALLARLLRRVIDAERPLLEAEQLSMWQYIVLAELGRAPASSQLDLARRIGYDKTRLIALLDTLETTFLGGDARLAIPEQYAARLIDLVDALVSIAGHMRA